LTRWHTFGITGYTNHTYHIYHTYHVNYTNRFKGGDFVKDPKGKYAWTATVGEKGQIVIPKQARDLFEIKPGDTLLLLGDETRGIAIPPKGAFAELFGIAFEAKETDKE